MSFTRIKEPNPPSNLLPDDLDRSNLRRMPTPPLCELPSHLCQGWRLSRFYFLLGLGETAQAIRKEEPEERVDVALIFSACAILSSGTTQEAVSAAFDALLWQAGKLTQPGTLENQQSLHRPRLDRAKRTVLRDGSLLILKSVVCPKRGSFDAAFR